MSNSTETYIRFGSHRARDYGLRAISRSPQSYYSNRRKTGPGGVYKVTRAEAEVIRSSSRHARFSFLRAPHDDLKETWSFT